MKSRLATSVCCLALMMIFSGCGIEDPPEMAIILNPTDSARGEIFSSEAIISINKFIYATRPNDLLAVIAAKHPLKGRYSSKSIDADNLFKKLLRSRAEQEVGEEYSKKDLSVPHSEKEKRNRWGWGTDHAAALRWVNDNRNQGEPLIILAITDGFNEGHPWSEVSQALQELFKKGPTRIIIIGLSQRIVDDQTQKTVADQWRAMLQEAGATDLEKDTKSSASFYLDYSLKLPTQYLDTLPVSARR